MPRTCGNGGSPFCIPQNGRAETGYWNPAIITDEKGNANITITMPDQSTAWKLSAKGITADTLCGEAETDLTAKKELFGELKLPPALTDGDDAQVQVTVHNSLVEKGPIEITLKTTIGNKTVEEHKTIDAIAKGPAEATFAIAVRRPAPDAAKPAGDKPADKAAEKPNEKPASDNEAAFELTVAAAGADRRRSPRRADSSVRNAGLRDRQRLGRRRMPRCGSKRRPRCRSPGRVCKC